MCGIAKVYSAITAYFVVSSSTVGFIEYIHGFYRYKMRAYTNIESAKKSLPNFLYGFLVGPTAPMFHLVGIKILDWNKCPKLK